MLRRVESDLWNTKGSATMTLAVGQIRALLEENALAMQELHTTRVFATATEVPPRHTAAASDSSSDGASSAAPRSEALTNPEAAALRREVTALQAEVARMRGELEAAHQRSATIAECQRKQSEMHAMLLRSAYDEAVEARDEAREDTARMRAQLEQRTSELAAAQQRASLQWQTMEAEMGLLAAEGRTARGELVGHTTAHTSTSAAGVHLGLLRHELRRAEDEAARAAAVAAAAAATSEVPGTRGLAEVAARPPAPLAPLDFDALRELRQWCEPLAGAPSAAPSAAELKHRQLMLARVERLEKYAEAAAERFAALQQEHEDLRKKHSKLLRATRRSRAEEQTALPSTSLMLPA